MVLQLKYGHVLTILICTYLPPLTGAKSFGALEQMQNFVDVLKQIYVDFPQSKFVIVGDFNIPGIDWCNTDFGVLHNNKSTFRIVNGVAELLQYIVNSLALRSNINICNSFDNYLDLNFSDIDGLEVHDCMDPLFDVKRSHVSLEITFVIPQLNTLTATQTLLNFYQADYIKINRDIKEND